MGVLGDAMGYCDSKTLAAFEVGHHEVFENYSMTNYSGVDSTKHEFLRLVRNRPPLLPLHLIYHTI